MDKGRELGIDPRQDPVWDALEGLRSSAIVTDARAYAGQQYARRERRRRFWAGLFTISPMRVATGIACLAAVAGVGLLRAPQETTLATRIGEIRKVQLADGSSVTLDTDTQVRVGFTGKARQITLVQGQAHFDVAHDRARPFTVSFGKGMVTAIGTSFDVTSFANTKMVTLLGGRVMVEGAAMPAGDADRMVLRPGQQVTLAPDGRLTPPRAIDLASVSSWQKGNIDLADLKLSEALEQVNRYSTTKIVVQEPSLAGRRVSGVFRAGDVTAVTAALCAYFDLKVVRRTPDAIILAKAA